jgi:hypothetical protein
MRCARTSAGSTRRSTTSTLASRRLTNKIDALAAQVGHMKGELIAEIRRVDVQIDGVERELRVAIDIRERLAAL